MMSGPPAGQPPAATPQAPPPGWYPDPGGGGQRWWDGAQWTGHLTGYPQQQQMDTGVGALVICGYIFAVVAPLVGLILGIITITRPQPRTRRHGKWIILTAVVVFALVIILTVLGAGLGRISTH